MADYGLRLDGYAASCGGYAQTINSTKCCRPQGDYIRVVDCCGLVFKWIRFDLLPCPPVRGQVFFTSLDGRCYVVFDTTRRTREFIEANHPNEEILDSLGTVECIDTCHDERCQPCPDPCCWIHTGACPTGDCTCVRGPCPCGRRWLLRVDYTMSASNYACDAGFSRLCETQTTEIRGEVEFTYYEDPVVGCAFRVVRQAGFIRAAGTGQTGNCGQATAPYNIVTDFVDIALGERLSPGCGLPPVSVLGACDNAAFDLVLRTLPIAHGRMINHGEYDKCNLAVHIPCVWPTGGYDVARSGSSGCTGGSLIENASATCAQVSDPCTPGVETNYTLTYTVHTLEPCLGGIGIDVPGEDPLPLPGSGGFL